MINKKSLWFLTLFSLILVLSVYYITMPSELLITGSGDYISEVGNDKIDETEISESNILVALRIEAEEEMLNEMNDLRLILNDVSSTVEEKNSAFEELKSLNIIRGEEENLEKIIEKKYELKSFVKIDGDQIRVIVASENHNKTLANDIIKTVQEQYKVDKYITVKFQS